MELIFRKSETLMLNQHVTTIRPTEITQKVLPLTIDTLKNQFIEIVDTLSITFLFRYVSVDKNDSKISFPRF